LLLKLDTPHGTANIHLDPADGAWAALVLGHGAGGGIGAPDLIAASSAARSQGVSIALVEQPYRVSGRRSPPPINQLEAAWTAVIEQLFASELQHLPLIAGGRSLGARVACRTAEGLDAVAVLCLAFPLQPPRRATGAAPASRLAELDAVAVPTLVVQGERDPFGVPPARPGRTVARVRGDHSLRADIEAVGAAVRDWLPGVLPTPRLGAPGAPDH